MSENERGAANPEESEPRRDLTFGEDAVGLKFNPGGYAKVDEVKKLYAKVIDLLNEERTKVVTKEDKARILSVAITEAQGASMWAVKGITK